MRLLGHVIAILSVLVWVNTATATEFTLLFKKSNEVTIDTQEKFLIEAQFLIERMEKLSEPKRRQNVYLQMILQTAYAEGQVTCVHNGWVTDKLSSEECSRKNWWAFDVTDSSVNPLFDSVPQEILKNTSCSSPDSSKSLKSRVQPCPLSYGTTKKGGLICAAGTRACRRESAKQSGTHNLLAEVAGCEQSKMGHKMDQCKAIKQSLQSEFEGLDERCKTTAKGIQNLCKQSQERMKKVLDEDGEMKEQVQAGSNLSGDMPSTCHRGDFQKQNGRMFTERECLFCNMAYETGVNRDHANDRAAVTYSLMNRVVNKSWGDDICSVTYQKHQFSWTVASRSYLKSRFKRAPKQMEDIWRESGDQYNVYQSHVCPMVSPELKPQHGRAALCGNHFHAAYSYPKWRNNMKRIISYKATGSTHHHYRRSSKDKCLFEGDKSPVTGSNKWVKRAEQSHSASDEANRCSAPQSTGGTQLAQGTR